MPGPRATCAPEQPILNGRQEAHLLSLVGSGVYSTAEVPDLFGVARSTAAARSGGSEATSASAMQPPPRRAEINDTGAL